MTEPRPTAGRPRDNDVDRRIADAAVSLFGENGWKSFSIESIARRAGVGKASVRLRWDSEEELLAQALTQRSGRGSDVDTGTVRGDLVALVRQLLEHCSGEHQTAALRMTLEARTIPRLAKRHEEMVQARSSRRAPSCAGASAEASCRRTPL